MSVEDVDVKPPVGPEYLGDAVYASYDGYHVKLHLDMHTAPVAVYLDPQVLGRLIQYAKRCGAL